jgi:TonB family protein
MSVQQVESMREVWASWQGQVLNGTFPLHRYLGGSDHSGVFLTELTLRAATQVAIKVLPAIATFADAQLARWNAAALLDHPHLIRVLETGRCQYDGTPYLYVVMEYADQNLAELLPRRPLTEAEAREMLVPALGALAFLHNRNMVQGQLKPANILAVGDDLKLASDTVCGVTDGSGINLGSVYDPPEAREGSCSTASDVWALGVTLFEALSQRLPSLDERTGGIAFPPGFPPSFRDVITACLSRRPYDRPKITELEAWVRRGEDVAFGAAGVGAGSVGASSVGARSTSAGTASEDSPAPEAVAPPTAQRSGLSAPAEPDMTVFELDEAVVPDPEAFEPIESTASETTGPPPPVTSPGKQASHEVATAKTRAQPTSRVSGPAATQSGAPQAAPLAHGAHSATAHMPTSAPRMSPPASQESSRVAGQVSGLRSVGTPHGDASSAFAPRAPQKSSAHDPSSAHSRRTQESVARQAPASRGAQPSSALMREASAAQSRRTPGSMAPQAPAPVASQGLASRSSHVTSLGAPQASAPQMPQAALPGRAFGPVPRGQQTSVPVAAQVAVSRVPHPQPYVARGPQTSPVGISHTPAPRVDQRLAAAARSVPATPNGSAPSGDVAHRVDHVGIDLGSPAKPTIQKGSLLPLAAIAAVLLAVSWVGVRPLLVHSDAAPPMTQSPPESAAPADEGARAGGAVPAAAATDVGGAAAMESSAALPSAAAAGLDAAVGPEANAGSAGVTAVTPAEGAAVKVTSKSTARTDLLAPRAAVTGSTLHATGVGADTSAGMHEEMPDIPQHVRRSIHGHVRVSVRVIVDKQGAVFAALVDDPGPSRYFERLALDAAKKWTFPPSDSQGSPAQTRRLELLRFDFTREGATCEVEPIQ